MARIIFDIETRVDRALAERVFATHTFRKTQNVGMLGLHEEIAKEQESANPMFPTAFHVPVSIAFALLDDNYRIHRVESVTPIQTGSAEEEERLVRDWWLKMEKYPDYPAVTFNGRRFDWPVLELAAFRYRIPIPAHMSLPFGRRYRWHDKPDKPQRHIDILDVMTNYGASFIRGGMNTLCEMMGVPGKGAMDGSQVEEFYLAGRYGDIDLYCRNDVRRAYLLYIRLELMRGYLSEEAYKILTETPMEFE